MPSIFLSCRRSGDAGAAGKSRIAELENDVEKLAAQAEELQRFTQEYMVKAASDKQKVKCPLFSPTQ